MLSKLAVRKENTELKELKDKPTEEQVRLRQRAVDSMPIQNDEQYQLNGLFAE